MGKKAAGALGALLLLAGADARYLLQTGRRCLLGKNTRLVTGPVL